MAANQNERGNMRKEIKWGEYEEEQSLEPYVFDSVVPGICQGCGEESDTEPDQRAGHCPSCGSNGVVSIMVLHGML
jgi:hypothetical protein